jgi:3',5'-cyclic AMP phosphodiesterase CpdA
VDGPPVVVAAGDIADCAREDDEATARLVEGIDGATVLTLGDNAYPEGSAEDFEECYEPSWDQFKNRTKPVPGNHEYETGGSSAYFDYFGKAAGDPGEGYYSYDLGSWHIVALNSNCGEGEIRCGPGSLQGLWLKEDLAAHSNACTLAYFHHPLFTSGSYRPGIERVERLWEVLYAAGVDVVLNGHDHNYQRFAPRILRGGRIPRMASGSSWLAQGAGASMRSRIRSPTRRSTTMTPTACFNSPCARRDTSGSSSPWKAKSLATPASPGATERLVEARRDDYWIIRSALRLGTGGPTPIAAL